MIRAGVTYCNPCSVEIPAGEPTHEFTSPLIQGLGHSHDGECLNIVNSTVQQFEETVTALSSLIDPELETANRVAVAERVSSRRGGNLRRLAPRGPRQVARRPKLATRIKKAKQAAKKRKKA